MQTIIGRSCHKYDFCCDKTRLLLLQKCVCHDKAFIATKVFVATKIFCCNKHNSVVAKCCCGKNAFVATKDVWQLSPMKQTSTVYV